MDKILYSDHARKEMKTEGLGIIKEQDVFEAIGNGQILEDYPNDKPYPSALILGFTGSKNPLHIVCAYDDKDDLAIAVTAYRPDPKRWIDSKIRR